MTPAFLVLLFLSAITAAAVDDDPPIEEQDTFGKIERANENIKTRLVDGDLVPIIATRNADPCVLKGCKWPKLDPYVYVPVSIEASNYTRVQRNIIIRALLTFHGSTCIRFHWKRNIDKEYISFFSGSGCWSSLGRQIGGQLLSLNKSRCLSTDTMQHEVLHALGFHHEQVRSDRDEHVTILTENIRPGEPTWTSGGGVTSHKPDDTLMCRCAPAGKEKNFRKKLTNNLDTPYDFDSVMQYGNFAFSSNGNMTIVSKADPDRLFGSATEMSQHDIDRVNALYDCNV
ncbi:high choriolytic enzyme 1-like isoform X1 [Pseudoliparis swirei]|uniref:high choriolytic enzyme 1-like isoform X1 n=1 Tax=Pseudoliparis swirei TaxID=2059687 RepID=UPI0024BEBEC8|nr:high choriolytic enzyme 1-like isoform X1 [Pseudoliparis swirei]